MQKSVVRSIMISLFILVPSGAVAQQAGRPARASAEISGVVRYAQDYNPADKVLVRLEFFSGGVAGQNLTDRTGKFRFTGLAPAIYIVIVRSAGYLDLRLQVDLQTTFREYLNFLLVAEKKAGGNTVQPLAIVDARIPPEAQKEYDLGRADLLESKKIESGIAHLRRAISLYPEFAGAHLLLGTAYLESRNYDQAGTEIKRCMEIAPDLADPYFSLGEVYRRQKKFDQAVKILEEGLKRDPKSARGHFNLGQVYFSKGEIRRAGPEVGRAIRLKSDFAEAYLLGGNIFLKARSAEQALQMFNEYLRLAPNGEYAAETRAMVEKIRKALSSK